MPENVRDRPTRAHEYLFLLTKQPRYFYDADAVREPDTNRCSSATGLPAADGSPTTTAAASVVSTNNGVQARAASVARGGRSPGAAIPARRRCSRRSWWSHASLPEPRRRRVVSAEPRGSASARRRLGEDGAWGPTCGHQNNTGRCLVLDPFCGSATTGAVAHRLGRNFLGVEPGRDTARLARRRLQESHPR